MTPTATPRALRLHAIRYEADAIHTFELADPQGAPLPPVEAGAHIDLHLPGGLVRSYSLCNAPGETHRYVVGVARDAASRGGSAWLHEQLRVGQVLDVAGPRNHFALEPGHTGPSVLVAGGIGVTPLYAMAQHLAAQGRPWALHYAVRSRGQAAFLPALQALADQGAGGRLLCHVDDEHDGRRIDIAALVAAATPAAHFYCCGPTPMLEAFRAATAAVPEEQVHIEYFKAPAASAARAPADGFDIVLARSNGRRLHVPPEESILDILLGAGVEVDCSCMEGICGSCQVGVLAGEPDHRDSVLSAAERRANKCLIACCSRARTPELVLDL